MEIINKENFDSKVEKGVVLVDFFANWCMPCKMLSPVLEEASELFGDKVSIYKVDVDKDNELAARKILLLATGENKAEAIYQTIKGKIDESCPSTILQRHNDVTIVVDKLAASKL